MGSLYAIVAGLLLEWPYYLSYELATLTIVNRLDVSYDTVHLLLLAASVAGGVDIITVSSASSSNLQLNNAIDDVIECRCVDLSPSTQLHTTDDRT